MKKIIIVFGVIAGIIVSILMVINMALWEKGILNLDNGEYVGYAGMVIAFLIAVAMNASRATAAKAGEIRPARGPSAAAAPSAAPPAKRARRETDIGSCMAILPILIFFTSQGAPESASGSRGRDIEESRRWSEASSGD